MVASSRSIARGEYHAKQFPFDAIEAAPLPQSVVAMDSVRQCLWDRCAQASHATRTAVAAALRRCVAEMPDFAEVPARWAESPVARGIAPALAQISRVSLGSAPAEARDAMRGTTYE
jgi:hypothetical protein